MERGATCYDLNQQVGTYVRVVFHPEYDTCQDRSRALNEDSHSTDKALPQTDQELFVVSDDELEKAASGTSIGYPGTGVATICVPDSPFPKGSTANPLTHRYEAVARFATRLVTLSNWMMVGASRLLHKP